MKLISMNVISRRRLISSIQKCALYECVHTRAILLTALLRDLEMFIANIRSEDDAVLNNQCTFQAMPAKVISINFI